MMVRRMVASAMMAIMISICVDIHTQILIRNAHGIIFIWDSRQMFAPNCSYQDYQCFGHQCEHPTARMNTTKTSQLTMPIQISWSSHRFESSQADHIYKDTGKYRLIKHKYPSKSCPRDLDSSQLQRFKTSLSSKHFLSTARIAEPGHGDQPKKNMSTVSICTHTDNAWIIHICNIYMYLYVCIYIYKYVYTYVYICSVPKHM